jgi:hypothetical protein
MKGTHATENSRTLSVALYVSRRPRFAVQPQHAGANAQRSPVLGRVALALAKQVGFAVDPERVLWPGRKPDRHFPPVRALVVVVPEFKTGRRQHQSVTGRRLAVDTAMIFVLIDQRRRLALDDVVEIDERLAIRPILVAAIFPAGGPQPIEVRGIDL